MSRRNKYKEEIKKEPNMATATRVDCYSEKPDVKQAGITHLKWTDVVRSSGFLGKITTTTLAHELFHLLGTIRDASIEINASNNSISFEDIPTHLRNKYDGKTLSQILNEVGSSQDFEDVCEESSEETLKVRQRGRPEIEQLCERVCDNDVCSWFKTIYRKIYNKSICVAKTITQYCVCFLCSFFKIVQTEKPDGKIVHYQKMLRACLNNIPTARNLQKYYSWYVYWKAAAIKTAKEIKEESKHLAWEKLEGLITKHLNIIAPQLAVV